MLDGRLCLLLAKYALRERPGPLGGGAAPVAACVPACYALTSFTPPGRGFVKYILPYFCFRMKKTLSQGAPQMTSEQEPTQTPMPGWAKVLLAVGVATVVVPALGYVGLFAYLILFTDFRG